MKIPRRISNKEWYGSLYSYKDGIWTFKITFASKGYFLKCRGMVDLDILIAPSNPRGQSFKIYTTNSFVRVKGINGGPIYRMKLLGIREFEEIKRVPPYPWRYV